MQSDLYARRRAELMRRIGSRGVALIHGSREARRNHDVDHKYRAPSDLLYLTGFGEPDSFAVLAPWRDQAFTMFLRPRDREKEIWTGRRLGVDGAIEKLGASRAFPIDKLGEQLIELLDGAEEVHYAPGDDGEVDRLVMQTLASLRHGERRGRRAPTKLVDLRTTLHEMRLIKDEDSLGRIRRAVEITAEAHLAAMRAARPGVHEYEIEALIDYTFRRRGCSGPGYTTIVGGGDNATILHYIDNSDALRDGDLLLVDAGGEYQGFTADVTRTWPVGRAFTPAQRRVYEIVLDAEKRCIEMVKPGVTIEQIHHKAVELLTDGMVRLGWLDGTPAARVDDEGYKLFYMHRTSHWLGLDVHDAGIYFPGGKPRPLAPGMVLTVEPGLYAAASARIAEPYRGIGVRIEDDVLVTESGFEVLTRAIPKEVDDLERIARERPSAS